jgi:hypothetical protein
MQYDRPTAHDNYIPLFINNKQLGPSENAAGGDHGKGRFTNPMFAYKKHPLVKNPAVNTTVRRDLKSPYSWTIDFIWPTDRQ